MNISREYKREVKEESFDSFGWLVPVMVVVCMLVVEYIEIVC